MVKYTARKMFRAGSFYIEAARGPNIHEWIKVREVPRELRCFVKPWSHTECAADFYTLKGAVQVSKTLAKLAQTKGRRRKA